MWPRIHIYQTAVGVGACQESAVDDGVGNIHLLRLAVVSEGQTAMCSLFEIFLILALFTLTNGLRLIRVKRLQVEEGLREV